jgi:hypothetical protein
VIDFVGLTSSRLDFLSELAKNRGPRLDMGLRKLLEKQCVGEKAVPRLYISLGPRFFANSLKIT